MIQIQEHGKEWITMENKKYVVPAGGTLSSKASAAMVKVNTEQISVYWMTPVTKMGIEHT